MVGYSEEQYGRSHAFWFRLDKSAGIWMYVQNMMKVVTISGVVRFLIAAATYVSRREKAP